MSGKEAIATTLGIDMSGLEKYQGVPRLYYVGNTYFTYHRFSLGSKTKLPDGYEWERHPDAFASEKYGIQVYRSEVKDAR